MQSLSKLQARHVMTSPVAYVMSETPLSEVANLLLREGISAAPVLDEGGHLVGMISEGDLVRRGPAREGSRRSWWLDRRCPWQTHCRSPDPGRMPGMRG